MDAKVHDIVASFAGPRKLRKRLARRPHDVTGRKIEFSAACHQEASCIEGKDTLGQPYRWHKDVVPLNVARADLPVLGFNEVQGIERPIDALRIRATVTTSGKHR